MTVQYQRAAPRRFRVAVVGVGSHSYRNILPTLTYLPVELVAVVARTPESASVVARQYGVEGYTSTRECYAREDLDAVILAVSPQMHPPLAIEAFETGLHVWIEKPAAVNVRGVEDLIAAKPQALVCVVGLKKAFMPAVVKAVELLASRECYPLRTLTATYPMDIPVNGEEVLARRLQPNWLLNGCHPLSVLVRLAGAVESVSVHRGRHGGGHCVLSHVGGAMSNLVLAEGAPKFQPIERYFVTAGDCSVEIVNSRRVVYQRGIDFSYDSGTSFAPPGLSGGAVVWEAQDSLNTLENKAVFSQGLYGSLEQFCASVLNGQEVTVGSLEFAREVMLVYEAALLSHGEPVAIDRGGDRWGVPEVAGRS